MARALSFIQIFLRQNTRARQNPSFQIRNLTVESKEGNYNGEKCEIDENEKSSEGYSEIVKEICRITRIRPRWELTLLSDYPSFNFSDPQFFREVLKQQNNALLSIRLFYWLSSIPGFSPDPISCNVLFDALVDAKACKAAKSFLDDTGLRPNPASLEDYIVCLSESGLVDEAFDVFSKLKEFAFCPSIRTWNSALSGCLKVGRTDLVWKLYPEMIESGAVSQINVQTVESLIQAFCSDGKVSEGYELLRQALEDGLEPNNVAFNKLISRFCKDGNFCRVSEILHAMIAQKCAPDIWTYEEIINGLCKKRKLPEACQVFSDLKDRGYAPDLVMYTTMITGLCKVGQLGNARKLWFEMISKGFRPNRYTYHALLHGYCNIGNFKEARALYKEMCDRGYGETTISYNTMISGFCSHGRLDEARAWFEGMPQKGIFRDVITYNTLIRGFCKEGKVVEAAKLLQELVFQGLEPSNSSYGPLIEKLCQLGHVLEAKSLWSDMLDRGLKPLACTQEEVIIGLFEQGFLEEAMDWFLAMLQSKLKPQVNTFDRLVRHLSLSNRLDDLLLVVDCMLKIGYALKESIWHSLVTKLCKENSFFVERSIEEILKIN